MKFSIDKAEQYAVFELLSDHLNHLNAGAVKAEILVLIAEGYKNIIFRAGAISEVDSSGIGTFLVAHRLCEEKGGIFIITEASEKMESMIEAITINSTINHLPTFEEGVDAVFLSEIESQLRLDETQGNTL